MKILYFFQELNTPMFQWQRKHFLEEFQHCGIEVKTFNPLIYSCPSEANEKLVEEAKQGGYDLFISNMGYYKMLFVDTLELIKAIGIPTMRIAWDNLMIPYIDEILAPHFDLVWLTAKETERIYKNWGVKYIFLPYAANPYTFNYKQTALKKVACFIGNPHGSRAIMINNLTDNNVIVELYSGGSRKMIEDSSAPELQYDIINPSTKEVLINRFRFAEGRKLIYGSLLNKIKGNTTVVHNNCLKHYPGLSHDEMVESYSSSVLSLASTSAGHTDVLKDPLPIINLRNFEIPMCGGIELCKYNRELSEYFEDGKEAIYYRDYEELVDKARYYTQKATEKEIYTIKQNARKRAQTDHTWGNRFAVVFEKLGLKYDKKNY